MECQRSCWLLCRGRLLYSKGCMVGNSDQLFVDLGFHAGWRSKFWGFEVLMKIFKQVFVCMCFEICIIIRIYHANMYNFSGHIFLWYQSLQVWFIKLYKIEIYHPWWLTLLFIQIVRQLLEEMKKSLVSSCSGYFLFYSFKMILFDPWYHYVQSVKYVCEKLALWAKVWMLDDASSWQVACAITSWPWNGGDYVLIIKFHNTVNMLNQG